MSTGALKTVLQATPPDTALLVLFFVREHAAYLPFGAGPHICISNHLMEVQRVSATLVQRVTLSWCWADD